MDEGVGLLEDGHRAQARLRGGLHDPGDDALRRPAQSIEARGRRPPMWAEAAPKSRRRPAHAGRPFTGRRRSPAGLPTNTSAASFDHFATTRQAFEDSNFTGPDWWPTGGPTPWENHARHFDVLRFRLRARWCGPWSTLARHLIGVDLSPAMVKRAGNRKVYDELVVAELTEYLSRTAGRA